MKIDISQLSQLNNFTRRFAKNITAGDIVFLKGDLGSGKTTFTQILLKELGYTKRVKSPTYAIYENYIFKERSVIHMDLYRLSSPEELYYLAIDEIFDGTNTVIIEWPDKGLGVLPEANKILNFKILNSVERQLHLDIT